MKRICVGLAVLLSATVTPSVNAIELLHYEFEQVDGSGPFTTPDSSGRGNTGTLMNMDNTNLVPGKIGNALRFNGGGASEMANRVEVPEDNPDFDRSYTEFTFAAWIKPDSAIPLPFGHDAWLAGKLGGSGNRGWQTGINPSNRPEHPEELFLGYFDGPSGVEHKAFLGPNAALADDTWMHWAVVFRANDSVKLYVNGSLVVTDSGALGALNGSNDLPLQIGNRGNNGFSSWNGLIDDVYIFDNALTDVEIAALVPEQPLVGDYNDDGKVDAADYTVWRDNLGQAGAGLAADGNGDGVIEEADYNEWKANFGATNAMRAAAGAATVPEPASAALIAISVLRGALPFMRLPRRGRNG